jgi:hypothetical protein
LIPDGKVFLDAAGGDKDEAGSLVMEASLEGGSLRGRQRHCTIVVASINPGT